MDLVAFGGAGIGAALAVAGTQSSGGIAAALFLVLVAAEFFLPLRAFGSAFHAVSYTHLDVYKRQALPRKPVAPVTRYLSYIQKASSLK